MLNIILLAVGFVVLIKGADFFIDGSSSIAANFKVPKVLIGLTIVAFGTSSPELAVAVKSLLSGSGDIVLGNVIGSNILNILLILGVSSMIHSLTVKSNTVRKELPITLMLTTAFAVLISDSIFDVKAVNMLTRGDGIIIVIFFGVFLYYLIKMARKREDYGPDIKKIPLKRAIVYTIVGLSGIIIGSHFVVESATMIAKILGITERMISLTIIALGTSLPELVTSMTATKKGEYDIAIGNVVGSNIFNIGMVTGVPVAILGGIKAISFSYVDLALMVFSAILLFLFSIYDYKITRKEGFIFLLIFVIYYGYVVLG